MSLVLWIRFLMVCVCDCNSDAAHEGRSRPIPTVLSHRHHHHQGASFIGVVVVVDDAFGSSDLQKCCCLEREVLSVSIIQFSLFQGMLETIEGFLWSHGLS